MRNLILFALISLISLVYVPLFGQNCPPSTVKGWHIVQPKETLYGLSKRYQVSIADLCNWNNLTENGILPTCFTLKTANIHADVNGKSVPSSYNTVASKSIKQPQFKADKDKIHFVEQGESLSSIATKYGYTVAKLMDMNNLKTGATLEIGQALAVNNCNCPNPQMAQNDVPQSYSDVKLGSKSINNEQTINSGFAWNPNYKRVVHIISQNHVSQKETPELIAKLYGITAAEVIAMNNLNPQTPLYAGQKLMIEDRSGSTDAQNYDNYALSNYGISSSNNNVNSVNSSSYTSNISTYQPLNNSMDNGFEAAPIPPQYIGDKSVPTSYSTTNNNVAPLSSAPEAARNFGANTHMTAPELTMSQEINLVRRDPIGYVKYVEEYISYLKKTGDKGNEIPIALELINELKRTPSLLALQPLECLYLAAQKHGQDQIRRGELTHEDSDRSLPWDRVLNNCPALKDGNENLVGGPSDIRRAVMTLLVDNGIPNRGHRRNLLNPQWKYVACHKMGLIGTMPNCWVQIFGN